jgi:hypothetical protein
MAKKTQTSSKPEEAKITKDYTIRQLFYSEKKYDENLIKSLERTFGEQKKSIKDWVDILSSKGITF